MPVVEASAEPCDAQAAWWQSVGLALLAWVVKAFVVGVAVAPDVDAPVLGRPGEAEERLAGCALAREKGCGFEAAVEAAVRFGVLDWASAVLVEAGMQIAAEVEASAAFVLASLPLPRQDSSSCALRWRSRLAAAVAVGLAAADTVLKKRVFEAERPRCWR